MTVYDCEFTHVIVRCIVGSSHDSLAKYLDDVKAATDPAFYEELNEDVQNIPSVLKSMKML